MCPAKSAADCCQLIPVHALKVGAELVTRAIATCAFEDCGGRCCRYGAMVSPKEALTISSLLPRLQPLLRPSARAAVRRLGWRFREEVHERYADPEVQAYASRVVEGACVFLLDLARGGCALHALALQDQVPVRDYKPRECLIFPLRDIVRGEVHLHRWPGFPCLREDTSRPPAYLSLQEELCIILGGEGYQELLSQVSRHQAQGQAFRPLDYPDPAPVPRGRPARRPQRTAPASTPPIAAKI